jgi:protocatechuate 3,4-dioxygenase beta subunit
MKKNTRRKFVLGALGTAIVAGVIAWIQKNPILRWVVLRHRNKNLKLTAAPLEGEDVCILTSQQVEGPFFITAPRRRDIKEDRTGKDLNLKLQVVRMPDCKPIEGAVVEIWHCDAEGVYSGYPEEIAHDLWKTVTLLRPSGGNHVKPTNEKRFLRGAQVTDARGQVEFETIFPGWYEPRTPHIHFKIVADNRDYLISQFYFEPHFCDRLYLHQTPYNKYGSSPFKPENDVVIKDHEAALGLLLKPVWSDDTPLKASARIGIQQMV